MDRLAQRLLIYAPPKEPWTTIAKFWENALLFPSVAGEGLDEFTYAEILDALAASI